VCLTSASHLCVCIVGGGFATYVAWAADAATIERLFASPSFPWAEDGHGNTLLHYAAALNAPTLARRLLRAGADLHAVNRCDYLAFLIPTSSLAFLSALYKIQPVHPYPAHCIHPAEMVWMHKISRPAEKTPQCWLLWRQPTPPAAGAPSFSLSCSPLHLASLHAVGISPLLRHHTTLRAVH